MIILYQLRLVNTHVLMIEVVFIVNIFMKQKHFEFKYNKSREDNSDKLLTMQQSCTWRIPKSTSSTLIRNNGCRAYQGSSKYQLYSLLVDSSGIAPTIYRTRGDNVRHYTKESAT
jgi:hypothetical protein